MTIEAGALSLRITETGAEQVERKLAAIDNKAKALGAKTVQIHLTAPGIERLDNQLEQLGKQAQLFSTGARFASTRAGSLRELGAVERDLRGIIANGMTPLEQRIRAEQTLASLAQKQPGLATSATAALGRTFLAYMSFNAVAGVYDKVSGAADRQETAQRKLGATARLTGESLATITAIAQSAQSRFAISSGAAADLTQTFVKLAARAGNVAITGDLMSRWMDLAAAQGLSLSDVLTGVNSTLMGQDEGLNRIGLQNPSNIYKQWADAAGLTVAQMTEQQKWQAIVNAVMTEGAKVQGEYSKSLESTQGKQQQFNAALETTAALFGKGIAPAREWAYEVGTAALTVLSAFLRVDDTLAGLPQKFKLLGLLFTSPGGFAAEVLKLNNPPTAPGLTLTPTLSPEARAAQLALLAPKTAAAPPTAAEIAAAKKRAEAIDKAAEKAAAISIGNIPLAGPMSSTPPKIVGDPTVGVDAKGKMKGVKAAGPIIDNEFDALAAKILERRRQLGQLLQGVGDTIGNALAAGFTAAFQGGNFFAEMGKALLAGIGSMIVQLGSAMLTYGLLMAVGLPLLIATPFAASALSAPAAIAAGTGLIALGAGMGALGGGGGKGGGGGGASARPPTSEPDEFAVAFDPDRKLRKSGPAVAPASRPLSGAAMPEERPVVQIGTLNALHPDDPRWQREIANTYNNARGRGLIRNG